MVILKSTVSPKSQLLLSVLFLDFCLVFLCLNLIDSVVVFGLSSITLSFLSPLYDLGSHPKGHILVDF